MRAAEFGWGALAFALLSTTLGTVGSTTAARAADPVTVSVYDAFVVEHGAGKSHAAVTIALSKPQDAPVTVRVATSDGTARSPDDYTATNQVIEVAAGRPEETVKVPVIADSMPESQESFTVTLSDPSGATIGDASAAVAIVDDDGTGTPTRDCDDANPYTSDRYDDAVGYCTHTVLFGTDLDGDRSSGAWVGGPDCDDSSDTVAPRFDDVPGDGIDNDCDGKIDGNPPRDCSDDNPYTTDRYRASKGYCTYKLLAGSDLDADASVGAWAGGPDCDDADPSVQPGATELPDGVDSNCDGLDTASPPPATTTGVQTIAGVGPPSNCPPSATCSAVVVDCLGLPTGRAYIAFSEPVGPPRGLLVMFVGSEGTSFYDPEDTFVPELTAAGFVQARVNWQDGWNDVLPGDEYGLTTAACRTATIVEHLHETQYLPLDLDPEAGVCGFCVTGNSGGALQSGYLLAEYGLESILDAIIVGGGPIPSRIAEACLEPAGENLWTVRASIVDYAYGVAPGRQGPCALQDASMEATWRADSLVDGGADFLHPSTRVDILIGGEDHTTAPNHATAYYAELVAAGSPMASYEVFPNAGHSLADFLSDPEARQGILDAFLWDDGA